ncbi:MAG: hypothetical protein LBS00_08850 [Synergistaceae bacterium]|nr:hypothetical protein [Synergistaceae bacterium]
MFSGNDIKNNSPEPGDILVWGETHVGLAIKIEPGITAVAHSIGTYHPDKNKPTIIGKIRFTCAEYQDALDTRIVNGPAITPYNPQTGLVGDGIGSKKETYRIRLVPVETSIGDDVWDGTIDTAWYEKNTNAAEFKKGSELAGLAKIVNDATNNFSGKTITLAANIDLAGREWTPISYDGPHSFRGTFDGNGRKIMNMTVEQKYENVSSVGGTGLFGVNGYMGRIINVHLTDFNITLSSPSSYAKAGGLVGYNHGGKIMNCTATGSVEASTRYTASNVSSCNAGGLAGRNGGTITNCTAGSSVMASGSSVFAGGLVGYNQGTIATDCKASGNVTASSADNARTGGFVGYNSGPITTGCKASGNVAASAASRAYVGGFVGYGYSQIDSRRITDCTASGNVTASSPLAYAGGFIGEFYGGAITNCTATGSEIEATGQEKTYKGGFAGVVGNYRVLVLTGNHNNTGISPAIGWDKRKKPAGPSDDI